MYHDKRFQTDSYFPLIAFNHEQIKQATTGGFVLAKQNKFKNITERLLNINLDVLEKLAKRLSDGEHVKPDTPEEKACYELIHDIDSVAHKVEGSMSSKKHMRNEVWSTISFTGAPTWFITFAPADIKHPICLYYADKKTEFKPEFRTDDQRYSLIAHNPIAGARFFHFMVEMFIKHVLGVNSDHSGLYGDTAAYYGTVEQQGRLTLHLHLMLWIENSLSPQQIRDKIMNSDSEFQQKIVEYLEGCHTGEFMTGTLKEVRQNCSDRIEKNIYLDPTMLMPTDIPLACDKKCDVCNLCKANEMWWKSTFPQIADDIILKSNVHNCGAKCMNNKYNSCKARFPREINEKTKVDPIDGSITFKKMEEWINTFTPILSYLLRCNSDVSSLLSGTAIKAIVAYVTDYITKVPLKTYAMFDTVRNVFTRKFTMINSDQSKEEKSRKLLTGIVNSLTANMEIGGPMAALYLLGNPDHYTNLKFRPFYWKPYINYIWREHKSDDEINNIDTSNESDDKIMILKTKSNYIAYSPILDYIYRPDEYKSVCLYDWIRSFSKTKDYVKKSKQMNVQQEFEEDESIEDELDEFPIDDPDPTLVEKTCVEELEPTLRNEISQLDNESYFSEDELDIINIPEDKYISSKFSSKRKQFKFLPDHPQHTTHSVTLTSDAKSFIPNFISPIPRSDGSDREYYCATIMALFKPWRSADDLKSREINWDTALYNHEFTDKQKKLMENFNIRYECQDARDDFRLQRAKKQAEETDNVPPWMSNEFMGRSDENADEEDFLDDYVKCTSDSPEDNEADEDNFNKIGKKTMNKLCQMKMMERILRKAGWMEPSSDGYENIPFELPDQTNIPCKTANAWKKILDQKKLEVLNERVKQLPQQPKLNIFNSDSHDCINEVKIVSEKYLQRSAKLEHKQDIDRIDKIIKQFTLNEEQERAFRIVAQHASIPQSDQLKMYLGGMGGTGKSQVIKALMYFFRERREPHRFNVLAPTGSAAVLVDGSTYHSVLGIRDIENESKKTRSQIKDRLAGVEYIFVDEVSMLSCGHMYVISKQLATALSLTDIPFGGMNMIFAGDFAQLPPVKATPLYDYSVGTSPKAGMTLRDQECTIGKAVWHQITTVVILRQNMRQRVQSEKDAKFRTALENMRYKSCTDEDVEFLRTLIAKTGVNIAQKKFAHVPIITSFNSYRDKINDEGTRLFAARHGTELHSFYSIDTLAASNQIDTTKSKSKKSKIKRIKRSIKYLTKKYQEVAWRLSPSSSEHVAGKLNLCVGMPVIIKKNIATECCITNGASATVWGWLSSPIAEDRDEQVFDTLFVELLQPPRDIQLEGLPKNVVPISKQKSTITCQMPNDRELSLVRQQVPVLPNFAMTVHASQGRTRINNICDLNNCQNHLAIYTALSRSSSADGTVILQGFDAKKIQGGITGYLRQEFRELEILDEITKYRYKGILSKDIVGNTRSVLLHKYYENKSLSYMPEKLPQDIAWSEEKPLILPNIDKNAQWKVLSKKTIHKLNDTDDIENDKDNLDVDIEKMNKEIEENQLLVQKIFESKQNKQTSDVHKQDVIVSEKILQNKVSEIKDKLQSNKTSDSNNIKSESIQSHNYNYDRSSVNKPLSNSIKFNSFNKSHTTLQTNINTKKHKLIQDENEVPHNKLFKQVKITVNPELIKPIGLKWFQNSCAYDSIIVVLYMMWRENPKVWTHQFAYEFDRLTSLSIAFQNVEQNKVKLENVRRKWREKLNKQKPEFFSKKDMDCIYTLQDYSLKLSNIYCRKISKCNDCHTLIHTENIISSWQGAFIYPWEQYFEHIQQKNESPSINKFINFSFTRANVFPDKCCSNKYYVEFELFNIPSLLSIMIPNKNNLNSKFENQINNLKYDRFIDISDKNQTKVELYLKAIIYIGKQHFVVYLFDKDNNIWFHDGLSNNGQCILRGQYDVHVANSLSKYQDKYACSVIYAKNL